ncbi:hypothetical protein CNE_1c07350 [Cupriavidus necator N-1]|uniref:Uncharacterized protein n=1 Tax=Cupriavidus necator (strain ATCC 43291 / DSM 13513 / CCUG 52238 / LMG 8453 / N-1) TaxID=1042878 RepID=G0EXJ4_CUPNN|nr:hypothetical protein CNE_1c07350 [Cupriavidus necator N-1]
MTSGVHGLRLVNNCTTASEAERQDSARTRGSHARMPNGRGSRGPCAQNRPSGIPFGGKSQKCQRHHVCCVRLRGNSALARGPDANHLAAARAGKLPDPWPVPVCPGSEATRLESGHSHLLVGRLILFRGNSAGARGASGTGNTWRWPPGHRNHLADLRKDLAPVLVRNTACQSRNRVERGLPIRAASDLPWLPHHRRRLPAHKFRAAELAGLCRAVRAAGCADKSRRKAALRRPRILSVSRKSAIPRVARCLLSVPNPSLGLG